METEKITSTKGWNWGYYKLEKEHMQFNVNNQKCFIINYADIALSNASGKNEVAIEFAHEGEGKNDKGDILTELRFYVPNTELDSIEEKKKEEKKKTDKEKEKEKKPKKSDEEGEEGEEDEDEDEEEEEQVTPAQIFNEKIIKAAGIGEFAGDVVASLAELPMIIPRGKYSFDLYKTFAKLHGRTNDYKILYKDINKGFLLPKPDGIHMAYVLHLKVPLRQGQTQHHFIALQFEREKEYEVTINLSPEQIKEQYGDKLQPKIEGPLYDVLSKLFKELIKINILIPGDFRSAKGEEALKCSVKASDGYLYPLKSSLIFIHKPVHYIKLNEIKFVEFSRIGQLGGSGMPSRSFDMTVTRLKDDQTITFAGIDKAEQKNLMQYLKSKGVKMRSVDVETNQQIDFSDEDEEDDEIDEEEKGAGKNKPKKGAIDEEEYDSEEDESFKDVGSQQSGEEEDDDDEYGDEDDDDVEMDEENIADDEVKQLQKDLGEMVTGKRRGRGGNDKGGDKEEPRVGKESKGEKKKEKKDKSKKKDKKKDK